MIAIINISRKPRLTGMQTYSLQINHTRLCTFRHRREDGLGECLRKAAKAADRVNTETLMELFRCERLVNGGNRP